MTAAPLAPAQSRPAPSLMPLLLLTLAVGLVGGWSLGALVYPGQGFAARSQAAAVAQQEPAPVSNDHAGR